LSWSQEPVPDSAAEYGTKEKGEIVDTKSNRLFQLIDQKSLRIVDEPIRLTTGATSRYYFDCKAVTLDGEALSLLADAFLDAIQALPERPVAIGGLTMGADFITAAVAMRGYERGLATVYGSIARKEPKKHGTMNSVENDLGSGTSIVVIDDVITSGKSTRIACEKFLEADYRITGIMALIDRDQGGRQMLEKCFGVPVSALYSRHDFKRIDTVESSAARQAHTA